MPLRLTTATPRLTYWKDQTTLHTSLLRPYRLAPCPHTQKFLPSTTQSCRVCRGLERRIKNSQTHLQSRPEGPAEHVPMEGYTTGQLYRRDQRRCKQHIQSSVLSKLRLRRPVRCPIPPADTLKPKLDKCRLTLSGTLATFNHRLVATQPTLNLPTQWEIEGRQPGEIGEVDEDRDGIMSKAFWQMLEAIKVQDNPCSRSKMTAVTVDDLLFKELHVALGKTEQGRH